MSSAPRCLIVRLAAVALVSAAVPDLPAQGARDPHLGYLYPAGGCRGTTVEVLVGGQFLQGLEGVHVVGQGVEASVVRFVGNFRLDGDQRKELGRRMRRLIVKRWDELAEQAGVQGKVPWFLLRQLPKTDRDESAEAVKLPGHPLISGLEAMSLRELLHVRSELLSYRNKKQLNAQLGQLAVLSFRIDSAAAPGDREVRLVSARGLSNPMLFHVSGMAEALEQEPNDPLPDDKAPRLETVLPELAPLRPPVVLNGQIMPGDVDRFTLAARRGQRLAIEVQARRLVPYLADAVPGWFQAVVAVYDEQGREVAYGDDDYFAPDPALLFEVPHDGRYTFEIRDAIHRGREDFVYRVSVAERPHVTAVFPLGGRQGRPARVAMAGWNLPERFVSLDTERDVGLHTLHVQGPGATPISLPYAVDDLPEFVEREPNDTLGGAQRVRCPLIVNGRINRPHDRDAFVFDGRAGEAVVVEVCARRLNSPLDAVVRLFDANGAVVAWNDDHMVKDGHLHIGPGLITHHADSYLAAELPRSGRYVVHLADVRGHGGEAYAYRLRISAPRPDFELCISPPSLALRTGRGTEIAAYVRRKDGFDGPVEVRLRKAPEGFLLQGGLIPAGCDRIRMTLVTARNPGDEPVQLRLEGRARIGQRQVYRAARPVENVMQAFLWRHLAPADALLVKVDGPAKAWRVAELADGRDVMRMTPGGTATIRVRGAAGRNASGASWELMDPPAGITLNSAEITAPGELSLEFGADPGLATNRLAENLIVATFLEREAKGGQKRRFPIGLLPAIPIEVEP